MPPPRLAGFDRSLFHPGQRVACALSGGADSTALLLALLDCNAERDALGVVLSAVHVHHGLRGAEADADEAFVRDLCHHHNIPLAIHRVDTDARRQRTGEGLEEAARTLRYAAFQELFSGGRCDAVTTAHTLDDQAETVVMKLLRGAWTEGLGGISPVLHPRDRSPDRTPHPAKATSVIPPTTSDPPADGGLILRPLLGVRRSAVEQFLLARNQPWRIDRSNQDLSLTRNRVRHELMPLLRHFNPAIDETLARTAALARSDDAFWRTETARLLPGLLLPGKPVRGGGRAVATAADERSVAVELDRLRGQPPAMQGRLLRAAAAQLGAHPDAVDTARLLALAGLAPGTPPGRAGARLELAGGLRAERSHRELRLTRILPPAIP